MQERSELSQNTLDHAQLAAVRFGQFKLFYLGTRRCAVVLRTLFSDGNIKTVVEYWSCRGGRAGVLLLRAQGCRRRLLAPLGMDSEVLRGLANGARGGPR